MIKNLTLKFIKFYQNRVSPVIRNTPLFFSSCRFAPTCSEYAYQSIVKYGTIRGLFRGFKRILRCNPLGGRGYDPVK